MDDRPIATLKVETRKGRKRPVIHILIDGAVDAPDTLGKMLGPERYQHLRQSKGLEKDGLLLPAEIANTYFHLAHQHRSAWTHELDLRAFSDLAWWNHATSVTV